MKKSYSKPEIVFESFAVSTNIAACGVDTNLPTRNHCGLELYPGHVIFATGISGCNVVAEDSDSMCYDNPSDSAALFAS